MTSVEQEGLSALKRAKKLGSRFAFEFFLEYFHPKIIEQFQKELADVTTARLQEMVKAAEYPRFGPSLFRSLHGYEDYLKHIKTKRLFEDLAEARPDLAQTLFDMGEPGLRYMVDLRNYFLDRVRHAGKVDESVPAADTPKEDIVLAVCDECQKSWPVKRTEFSSITKCPFCGHPTGEAEPKGEVQ